MKEQRIQQWTKNFNEEIVLVELEFKSFFKHEALKDYYQVKVHDVGYISIDILNRHQLPIEIIDATTLAFLRAVPRC